MSPSGPASGGASFIRSTTAAAFDNLRFQAKVMPNAGNSADGGTVAGTDAQVSFAAGLVRERIVTWCCVCRVHTNNNTARCRHHGSIPRHERQSHCGVSWRMGLRASAAAARLRGDSCQSEAFHWLQRCDVVCGCHCVVCLSFAFDRCVCVGVGVCRFSACVASVIVVFVSTTALCLDYSGVLVSLHMSALC